MPEIHYISYVTISVYSDLNNGYKLTHSTSRPQTPSLLYIDQDILLINKPAGLLSVPDGYHPDLPHLRDVLEPQYGQLWMVHRLDKETSGILILARTKEAHRNLNKSFRIREVKKIYYGLVSPVPDWRKKAIHLPLIVDADRKHRTRVDQSSGKPARSICKVMKIYPLGVLMEITLLTGISHQIRAHLRAYNLCLLGETLYNAGLPDLPLKANRMMLHAPSLAFPHPATGKWVQFIAPYPDDFRKTYTRLRTTTNPDGLT